MRCQFCGAELADGVLFCGECGARVEKSLPKKRFCRECGAASEMNAKFCSNCGAKLFAVELPTENSDEQNRSPIDKTILPSGNQVSPPKTPKRPKESAFRRFWTKLDLFMKIACIATAVFVVFLLVAVFAKNTFGIIISALQLCGLIVAILMHREVIKLPQKWIGILVLGLSILLVFLNVYSYTWGRKKPQVQPASTEIVRDASDRSTPAVTFKPTKAPAPTVTPKPTEAPSPVPTPTPAIYNYQLLIEIDFEANLFFSTYNVELYLDDQHIATMPHGKYFTTLLNVQKGKHVLSFKQENGSNRASVDFELHTDSTYTCKISCYSSSISISNKHLTESVRNITVSMPDTVGMLYSDALSTLKELGLINISYKTVGNHSIWVDSNWLVQGQNVEAGTNIPKSEEIKLECISLEDYWKATYIGKNISEIQKLADEKGFTIMFQDKSEKNLDIDSMDSMAKEDWVATNVRQYSFTGSTAVVTVEFTGIPSPTPIPTNTPIPAATEETTPNSSKNTPKATSSPKPTKKASANYHSSNDREVAKKGNSGVFAYKKRGTYYDQYYIIDFDEGYVYYFCHGNGDGSCDRVKITSGNLNSYVLITYHDGGTTWQEALRFHYKNMPDTMILEDHNHYEYKFNATNLDDALKLRNKLEIIDY